ncbi:serine/arginine repetitive matrix 1 [Linnemannia elongata AG-77]|uniref:Serine/arginine repetitive matrix 1 n=1 Tax=Linnemannia elongata AG-77 TaxID=1314771 RepID=A0A197K759_9FUNG|nr:serine/arginine repetitive matrix 1 [Linnemannia elongata AG-77]
MGDAGFFKGTSAGQDTRFSDKHKKMLKSMNFPPEFSQKVDMKKVNMKVIKDWMAERVIQLLGIEDEVVVEYAIGMLEEPSPDPKSMQINLQGFLDKNTQLFVLELWKLLISAQTSLGGIPQQFLDITKAEILKTKQAKEDALARIREQEEKERAIAAELRQKAQAIREASRPKALDVAKVEPFFTLQLL